MPVARPLRALLRFTASLMLLMLFVVSVVPCVGSQWLVFGGGLPLFPGWRWLVRLALTRRVCSRWCGPLVVPLVRVLQAMPRVMSPVRMVLVAPVVWVPLVTVWWMESCAMLRTTVQSRVVLPARAPCRVETGESCFWARCARAARRATSPLWANGVLPARAGCRVETGGSGFCARRTTTPLWVNGVLPAGAACRVETGGSGLSARHATTPLWTNGVLPAGAACRVETGSFAFCACRKTSLLWANGVLLARAACRVETGGSCLCACRATSLLCANGVLPARAACRVEMR